MANESPSKGAYKECDVVALSSQQTSENQYPPSDKVKSHGKPKHRKISPSRKKSMSSNRGSVVRKVLFSPLLFSGLSFGALREIFEHMKSMFSEFTYFDSLVAEKLRQAILQTAESGIHEATCSSATIVDSYYRKDIFNTPERKLILDQIMVVFKTCYVYMISRFPESLALRYETVGQLLEKYPEFSEQNETELAHLLEFRNAMKIAMQIIPPDKNKNVLIKVAERLEGANRHYVTGGGQKPAVHRRVSIYRREGGDAISQPAKTKKRAAAAAATATDAASGAIASVEKKRKAVSMTSMKKLKLLKLSSDELKDLSKGPGDCFDDYDFSDLDPLDFPPSPAPDAVMTGAASLASGSAPLFPLAEVDSAASNRLADLMEFGSRNAHLKLGPCISALCGAVEIPSAATTDAATAKSTPGQDGTVRTSFSPPVGALSVPPAAKAGSKPRSVSRDVSSEWDMLPDAALSVSVASILW